MFRIWLIVLVVMMGGCADPKDTRPGMKLGGEAAPYPADWTFTNAHKEIAVEVSTPYLLPHSVTIWCGVVDGRLHVAARDPDSKNWPGWVDDDPDVTLKIGDDVYLVRLSPIDDPTEVAPVQAAYAEKYQLPGAGLTEGPPVRYWAVVPRA
jgi:hypothetical protein